MNLFPGSGMLASIFFCKQFVISVLIFPRRVSSKGLATGLAAVFLLQLVNRAGLCFNLRHDGYICK